MQADGITSPEDTLQTLDASRVPSRRGEIFVVDDDPAIRKILVATLSNHGYEVADFADGTSLLIATQSRTPICILLDVNIPGRSGLDILKQLNAEDYPAPIFIMSGQGDIPMAVEAIKHGALDFIEKPFRGAELVARLEQAAEALKRRRSTEPNSASHAMLFPGYEPLTRREREVLAQVMEGASSKEVGHHLGISPRTVEVHRARVMDKLGAKNTADLIRIVMSH